MEVFSSLHEKIRTSRVGREVRRGSAVPSGAGASEHNFCVPYPFDMLVRLGNRRQLLNC